MVAQDAHTNGDGSSSEAAQRRRPYVSPQLREYGKVRDLTTGGSGTVTEGKSGQDKMKFP